MTVFEAIVDDASATDLKRTCNELSDVLSGSVKALIMSMNEGEYSASQLQNSSDLKQLEMANATQAYGKTRPFFRKWYLWPALHYGLIDRTIPDKPTSSKQQYFLTKLGQEMKKYLNIIK